MTAPQNLQTATVAVPAAAQAVALRRLSAAIQLQRKARDAGTVEDLAFVAVNETQTLVPYRQAILLGPSGRVASVSGLAKIDRDAPFVVWAEGALRGDKTEKLNSAGLAGTAAADWGRYLPAHALRLALSRDGENFGALVLAREEPFADAEIAALDIAADAYAHALQSLAARGRFSISRHAKRYGRAATIVAALAGVAAGFVPVRESVLAPGELVAIDAAAVRAGLDGVVDRVHVRPNQPVAEGEILATLDARRIDNQIDVARKALDGADAELRQTVQAAVFDPRARAAVAGVRARQEQAAAELAYQTALRERLEIRSPRAGIAVFDDAGDLVGRPIALGERLMQIADPAALEIEIRLPVGDAIRLAPGAETRLFLNIDPQRPVGGTLVFVAYRAQPGPDATMSYRLKARIDDPGAEGRLRLGLKGTAKIYGESVPLALYVFRRPIAAFRQWLGL